MKKQVNNQNFHRTMNWLGIFGIMVVLIFILLTLKGMHETMQDQVTTINDCCDENNQMNKTLTPIINQSSIDSGLLAVQFLLVNEQNCVEIDTTIIVDCNEVCQGEVIEEKGTITKQKEEVVETSQETKKEIAIKKEIIEEQEILDSPDDENEADTVVEESCPELLDFTLKVDKVTDSTTTDLYTDSSSVVLGIQGFEKKTLSNLYSYNDEFGVQTDLNWNARLDGEFARFELTEKKEGAEPELMYTKSLSLNESNSYDLTTLNGFYKHQHMESTAAYWNTKKAGTALAIAGPTKAGLVYVSQRILRKRPDIVYQDYNGLGLDKSDNPWSLINKNEYTPEQLAQIETVIDNNESEARREKEHVTWQRINDVVFVASLIETAAGVTLLAIDGKEKKNKFVVTPVGVRYYHTIGSK